MFWSGYMGNANNWNFLGNWWMLLAPLALLDLVLKGLALWRSAQRGEKWWFIALLLVNSLGILPFFYLLTHQTKAAKKKK